MSLNTPNICWIKKKKSVWSKPVVNNYRKSTADFAILLQYVQGIIGITHSKGIMYNINWFQCPSEKYRTTRKEYVQKASSILATGFGVLQKDKISRDLEIFIFLAHGPSRICCSSIKF